ncbi:MAG: RNA 3'-terminal phosphate cyclase [Nitrospirae bacterium]|nr:RNA 3'-terminal phosphate cyclase [Nitrospirota bacterium]
MIEIDGSYGEGGGQILRTALSLSCLFKKPFRIFNIRKGRKKPGLMPQHITSVRAAQLFSSAEVTGDQTGFTELLFLPKEVKGGDFFFDIGTAGSTSLVLQTIIPSLVFLNNPPPPPFNKGGMGGFSGEKTTIILKGGTHVPFSPSFHYLVEVFVPFLKWIGVELQLTIESYGFYPKGGGKVRADIFPAKEVKPLRIVERGNILRLRGYSGVGNLPLSIAERQRSGMLEKIYSQIKDLNCPVDIELLNVSTPGQGTFIFLQSESENSIAGFTSLGERGKRAEAVGEDAAMEFLRYYSTDAAFDSHISDQIVLYLSICREESSFTTSCITHHLMTYLWVIGLFHEFRYAVEGEIGKPGIVRIN